METCGNHISPSYRSASPGRSMIGRGPIWSDQWLQHYSIILHIWIHMTISGWGLDGIQCTVSRIVTLLYLFCIYCIFYCILYLYCFVLLYSIGNLGRSLRPLETLGFWVKWSAESDTVPEGEQVGKWVNLSKHQTWVTNIQNIGLWFIDKWQVFFS